MPRAALTPAALPRRVLILGANGFIAHHLRTWCARREVPCHAIRSRDLDLTQAGAAARLADLLEPAAAVIMTSMLTPEKGRNVETLMSNLRMAETVCRALRAAPCSHFVYLSSDAVYDARRVPLDENSSREPVDFYALAHTAREMMLAAELAQCRIPLCVLRLTATYGPGDTHNAYGPNRFVRSAVREGRIQLFGRGEERRSHVFVEDVANLVGHVLQQRSTGILNVAVKPAASFAAVAAALAGLLDGRVRIEHVSRAPGVAGPLPGRSRKSRRAPGGAILHRPFANDALFKAFPGFAFTPMKAGLAATIEAERNSDPAPADTKASGNSIAAAPYG